MKAYTDIEQSKKLAEILPVESADMFLALDGTLPVMSKYIDDGFVTGDNTAIPCWSLTALLNILPQCIDVRHELVFVRYDLVLGKLSDNKGWYVMYDDVNHFVNIYIAKSNLLDACVEMITKLKEKDLI